jgi:hypothetical protein
VPLTLYLKGCYCNPNTLLFYQFTIQKNFVVLYHTGKYAEKPLLDGVVSEYINHSRTRRKSGKRGVRLKKRIIYLRS